jgi:hypothetical protein
MNKILSVFALVASVTAIVLSLSNKESLEDKVKAGRVSVFDFGAKGDGVTDDTKAIQAGLDFLAKRGGGKLYFPYTKNGYLVASPGKEFDKDGKIVRAQLIIPSGKHVIELEGEMPAKILYEYQVRPDDGDPNFVPTRFGNRGNMSVMIRSSWNAPEITDPKERPWAMLAAPEGTMCEGHFSVPVVSIKNLEFAVHLNKEKMYPTMGAVNLQNSSRIIVSDSQFCLDDHVGDWDSKKELLENPCHVVGLMGSGAQSDDQIIRNVAVQGFKYGIVLSEHTTAEHIYVHNCEHGVAIASATHPIIITRILAQHNQRIISILPHGTFGRIGRTVYLKVGQLAFERGEEYSVPVVSNMKYAIWDPNNRLYGSLEYMQGWPGRIDKCFFPVRGGKNFKYHGIGEKNPDAVPRKGILSLSFDDRNLKEWVAYLDTFDKYGAKVTFFLSGAFNAEDLKMIRKIKERGHAIGIHGLHHKEYNSKDMSLEASKKYFKEEFQPQIDMLRTIGITPVCAAMPNNVSNRTMDNFLVSNGFKRIRARGNSMSRNNWRNSTAYEHLKVLRGVGLGELYNTNYEDVLKDLEYGSDSNSIMVYFSHSISSRPRKIDVDSSGLEKILSQAQRLGMAFMTYED